MPSRHREFTGAALEQRIEQGRGQHEGAQYRPWFYVWEVPSRGTCSQPIGWRHGRTHHLLSGFEKQYFYLLEWSRDVLEIREQFPLFKLSDTLDVARALGARHPMVNGEPVLMTTDFMITVRSGGERVDVARTVKRAVDLKQDRVIEKLEIERCYYEERGIDWALVTEEDLPRTLWKNVEYLHKAYFLKSLDPLTLDEIRCVATVLSDVVRAHDGVMALSSAGRAAEKATGAKAGVGLKVARFLLARKAWAVDMTVLIVATQDQEIAIGDLDALWETL